MSTTDLYTTVRNVSGKELTFSYLGVHGKKLAANAQTTIWGHIQHSFGHGQIAHRKRKALERDLLAGRLAVISTPTPILNDATPDAALANPSVQATVNVTGGGASGGALPAGTYFASYTFYNAWGETLVGTSRSAQFTVSAGNIPRVTFAAIPSGATGVRIYVTEASGAAGTERRYSQATSGTTADLAVATYSGGTFAAAAALPTANTTKAASARALSVADNTLGTVDPSWGRYVAP